MLFVHGQGSSLGVLDSGSSQWPAPFHGFSYGSDPCPWLALPNVLCEMPDEQKTMPLSCEPEPAVRTEPERQNGELSIKLSKRSQKSTQIIEITGQHKTQITGQITITSVDLSTNRLLGLYHLGSNLSGHLMLIHAVIILKSIVFQG